MSHKVVEKNPKEGYVFLVKYTFDNTTWNQFFATRVHESGGAFTFFGCRVKVAGVDLGGQPTLTAGRLPDMQLDGKRARLLALLVKEPAWFGILDGVGDGVPVEGMLTEVPDFALSSLRLPGLEDYK